MPHYLIDIIYTIINKLNTTLFDRYYLQNYKGVIFRKMIKHKKI